MLDWPFYEEYAYAVEYAYSVEYAYAVDCGEGDDYPLYYDEEVTDDEE